MTADTSPRCTIQTKHTQNILGVDFHPDNNRMLSCAVDGTVYEHDLNRNDAGGQIKMQCEDIVVKAVYNPFNPNLFAAASFDGRAMLCDLRCSSSSQLNHVKCVYEGNAVGSVAFHPSREWEILVCEENALGVQDLRYHIESEEDGGYGNEEFMFQFNTTLRCNSSTSGYRLQSLKLNSACYDEWGDRVLCLAAGYYPLIYVSNAGKDPVRILYDSSYKDTQTIKSATFASPSQNLVACGSNNACVCVWDISSDLTCSLSDCKLPPHLINTLPYSSSSKYAFSIKNELLVLPSSRECIKKHTSFVNSVIAHPTLPVLCSAGVENTVKLHSPFPLQFNESNLCVEEGSEGENESEMEMPYLYFDILNSEDSFYIINDE